MTLVVLGDAFLDVDVDGAAHRLAPDAPVPVVSDVITSIRPGGAALAATMLARDGHVVTLVCALGRDRAAQRAARVLEDGGVRIHDLAPEGALPQKVRVRARGQCIARVDVEPAPVRADADRFGEERIDGACELLAQAAAVLVADYGRGIAAHDRFRAVLAAGGGARRPVVWDPHPAGPDPVAGVQLTTPNDREGAARLGLPSAGAAFPQSAADVAQRLRTRWRARSVAVTCGDRGAVLAHGDGVPMVVPIEEPSDRDACGAGDRFATAALGALARGALPSEAVRHAVHIAAGFVAAGGVAAYSHELTPQPARPLVTVATSGCFDLLHAGHVSMLRAARALGDRLVVCLNSDASVRRLKGAGRPVVPCADRRAVLEGLECVDEVVVFDDDTPVPVLESLRPSVFVKGGDYDALTLPEAPVLARWGGHTVVVPYLHGRSTTRLVQEARHAG